MHSGIADELLRNVSAALPACMQGSWTRWLKASWDPAQIKISLLKMAAWGCPETILRRAAELFLELTADAVQLPARLSMPTVPLPSSCCWVHMAFGSYMGWDMVCSRVDDEIHGLYRDAIWHALQSFVCGQLVMDSQIK